MCSITDIQWTDLVLIPQTKGKHSALEGIIAMGEPYVVDAVRHARISKKEIDPEILASTKDFDFTYLRLALSLRPQPGMTIRLVAIDIDLLPADNSAIAWSMQPIEINQEVKTKNELKLSSTLKLNLLETSVEDTEGSEFIKYQPIVQGFNVMRADPAWEFKAAQGRNLSGIQVMHMVVRSVKGIPTKAHVRMKAEVSKKAAFWTYEVQRPDRDEHILTVALTMS